MRVTTTTTMTILVPMARGMIVNASSMSVSSLTVVALAVVAALMTAVPVFKPMVCSSLVVSRRGSPVFQALSGTVVAFLCMSHA
jgi:hypothetical protein